jgi:hypothetical protein
MKSKRVFIVGLVVLILEGILEGILGVLGVGVLRITVDR